MPSSSRRTVCGAGAGSRLMPVCWAGGCLTALDQPSDDGASMLLVDAWETKSLVGQRHVAFMDKVQIESPAPAIRHACAPHTCKALILTVYVSDMLAWHIASIDGAAWVMMQSEPWLASRDADTWQKH